MNNIKCPNCGLENENKNARCVRCNSILRVPKGCGNCKGCSLSIRKHGCKSSCGQMTENETSK